MGSEAFGGHLYSADGVLSYRGAPAPDDQAQRIPAERSCADTLAPSVRPFARALADPGCKNGPTEGTPKNRPVDLVMYDLSKGLAGWMRSALLSGQKWEAIWHTGVRVFGFEFWYGGDIIQAPPEILAFGIPMRIVRLGNTQRKYKEFR